MSASEFTAPAPPGAETVEYASFSRRLGAALLDSLVWIIAIGFFNPGTAVWDNETAAAIVGLVILSAWFNYFAFCEWRWGQTIGKNATGIRVLPLEGGRLTWQAAALRNLLRLVDLPLALIGADYVIVRGSPRRQRLGDRAAKTIVVREADLPEESDREPLKPAPPAPTAGELFGDATDALSQHPAAGSSLTPRKPPPDGPPRVEAEQPMPIRGGFPYADWDLRRTMLGLLGGLLLGGIFAPLLVLPFDPDLSSTGALLVAQALLEVSLVFVAIRVAMGSGAQVGVEDDLNRLGVRRFQRSAFGWLALAMFSYYAAAIAYSVLLVSPDQEDIARDLGLDAGVLAAIPVVGLIVVIVPIAEEIFFRGMLFGGLRLRMSRVPAAAVSAVVFGALHATTGLSAVPPLIVFGFVLALLYERTGSLVPGMIAHALNNSLALIAS